MRADFPFARSLIVLRNTRTLKKTNQSTTEPHYYISSALPEQYQPAQWLALIRGHWAGVEVRNHWRRDVLFGEDGSCSRSANLLANMALIRNALLSLFAEHLPETAGPEIIEQLSRNPSQSLRLLGP
jgi:predicted transposase YbfD/YdcC